MGWRAWVGAGLLGAALWAAAFELPRHLGRSGPRLVSTSWAVGFDNGLAVAGVAAVLALAALARLRAGGGPVARFPGEPAPLPAWPLALLAGWYALLTAAGHAWATREAGSGLVWEVRHFLHRLRLEEQLGLRPYVDFHSEYGPLLAWLPGAVHRALAPVGLDDAGAYFVALLLLELAGLGCAFWLASRAAGPVGLRGAAFALVAVGGFMPYLGLNGATLRFLLPLASLLLGHRLVARAGGRAVAAAAVAAALAAANLAVSTEVGVAFGLGWLCWAALRREPALLLASAAGLGAAALAALLALPPAVHASLLRFGAGANNLPLVPAPHLVFYLLTLGLLVPPALAAGLRRPAGDGPLVAALAATCVALMPGALGRADPPHALLYGLGPGLLLLLALAGRSRAAFAAFAAAWAVVWIGLFHLANVVNFHGLPLRRLAAEPRATARAWLDDRRAELAPRDLSFLPRLDRYPGIGAPFATWCGDHEVEAYLLRRRLLGPEYFIGTVGVYTEADLARKLADVGRFEHLLVNRALTRPWPPEGGARRLREVRRFYLAPVDRLRWRRDDLDPVRELVGFIAERYEPVEELGRLVVLRRREARP